MDIEDLPRTQSAPPTLEEHQKIQEDWLNQQDQVRFLSRNKRAYSEASLTVDSVGDAEERNLALFASDSTQHEPRVSIHHDVYMVIRPRIVSPTTANKELFAPQAKRRRKSPMDSSIPASGSNSDIPRDVDFTDWFAHFCAQCITAFSRSEALSEHRRVGCHPRSGNAS
ncbi:hypothetical protein SCAR479_08016 [Seiridium cardinale]|uniref:C2H2-type domain-containing protein n=1 Tax=Seiridium cardinale TaxID=138064 RepID=A0ABR2XNU4_9PEZI